MADYWVSQNRKYCEFCKCWITDNKPSVDFHEKGRRHQENVKKRLRNITKQSNQVQRTTTKTDATIKLMEVAAMEAYKKDMETGGDLSSSLMKGKINSGAKITKLWNEARTRDGKTYYYNIMTKETVWQPPREGYLTIQEQRAQAEAEAQNQLKAVEKFKRQEALMTMQQVKEEEMENEARKNREKLKERRVVDDLPATTCGPLLEPGKTDPYGKWQTIQERPVVDLQLPVQDYYYEEPVVQYEPEAPVKEFKEKTVESLGGESSETGFKKRKFGGAAKRNVRQRLDDD
ncbi:WW domain-binding protein 4 isoform X2 [Tribolium castaneum]|nr:PREDICTED: WW domain-binding protein 4 isoform X2 [Tribolium castaneum]|eukprot:XP_971546.2 PREDICTED: WW domain-binding protein 4 isoform X2 [Tribolium castaneum]